MTRPQARFGALLRTTALAGLLAATGQIGSGLAQTTPQPGSPPAGDQAPGAAAAPAPAPDTQAAPVAPGPMATTPMSAPMSAPAMAATPVSVPKSTDDILVRGKYLTDMADCASCHSREGGARFAGGRAMGMPFGTLYTPNITSDPEYGIGKYTDADFERLFKHGVNRVGKYVYPGMPYPWYASIRDDDIHAIRAYLMSQPAVHEKRPDNEIFFPFTLRPGIGVWNAAFVPSGTFKDDPAKSAQVNRGEYIVNGFAHCSECHNGRTLLGKSEVALPLQGGVITHWATPNITNDAHTGIGRYTDEQLFNYLKTGADDHMGTAVGPMMETVSVSLSKLADDDIRAMIAYLRTQDRPASYSPYKRTAYQAANAPGANVYYSFCSSCHGVNGKGVTGVIPALDGNGMVRASGPHNVINTIIGGVQAAGTFGVMPALGNGMTDQQIADVTNYVRQAWSNDAPPNATPFLVSVNRIYADGAAESLLNGKRASCPKLELPALQTVLDDSSNGIVQTMKAITVPTLLQSVNSIVAKVKQAAPDLKPVDITNGLTVAYCPIVEADASVPAASKSTQLANFSTRVYTQLRTDGSY